MVQRRARHAGIDNHRFRATGITAFLRNGGTLEKAAAIAHHASTRTTQLYDRRSDEVNLDEIERIGIWEAIGCPPSRPTNNSSNYPRSGPAFADLSRLAVIVRLADTSAGLTDVR